jgi:hypothetical protein
MIIQQSVFYSRIAPLSRIWAARMGRLALAGVLSKTHDLVQ